MKILGLLFVFFSLVFGAVDINNVPAKELTTLKGIGVKKAEAIIIYRERHCFTTVDKLTKVKGIGKKTLEKNRENIKTGTCK